jgi:radical SAM protein with 4Fe4S-binding SPASM domain
MAEFKNPPELRGLDFTEKEVKETNENNRLLRVTIETSMACNLRCKYCFNKAGKPLPNELDKEEIKGVIDQALQLGAKCVIFIGGGEPLLYKDIFELIEYVNEKGATPLMFTNGTLATKGIAKRLFENNVSIIPKLNSFRPDVQDYLAGMPGAYQRMRKGLENLIRAGFNKAEPSRLALESIICRKNYIEIPRIFRFCRKNNIIPYLELISYKGRAKENADLLVSSEEAKKLFYKILAIDRAEFGFDWVPIPPIIATTCQKLLYNMYVDCQGNVKPCVAVDVYAGNVREKSLKEMLQSKLFQSTRNIKKNIKGKCRACEYNLAGSCCGGCRGNTYNMTGDLFAQDPICWHNK